MKLDLLMGVAVVFAMLGGILIGLTVSEGERPCPGDPVPCYEIMGGGRLEYREDCRDL